MIPTTLNWIIRRCGNLTFAKNISTIDLSPVDTDMNNIQFLGIDMPNVFSPARDVYTMLKAGLNVPIIIGNAVGIEESLVELIVGIIGLLSLLGFLFLHARDGMMRLLIGIVIMMLLVTPVVAEDDGFIETVIGSLFGWMSGNSGYDVL